MASLVIGVYHARARQTCKSDESYRAFIDPATSMAVSDSFRSTALSGGPEPRTELARKHLARQEFVLVGTACTTTPCLP